MEGREGEERRENEVVRKEKGRGRGEKRDAPSNKVEHSLLGLIGDVIFGFDREDLREKMGDGCQQEKLRGSEERE